MSAALALLLALVVLAPGTASAAVTPATSTTTATTVSAAERCSPAPDGSPSSPPVVAAAVGAEAGDDQPEVLSGDGAASLVAGRLAALSCSWTVRPVLDGAPVTVPD